MTSNEIKKIKNFSRDVDFDLDILKKLKKRRFKFVGHFHEGFKYQSYKSIQGEDSIIEDMITEM